MIPPLFPARGIGRSDRADFFCFIPHTNRLDLTYRAVASVEVWWPHLVVVDNSPGHELRGTAFSEIARVVTMPTPITFTQMQNWARQKAFAEVRAWYAFMHNDAAAAPGVPEELAARARANRFKRWGAIFTNYDALVAYNTDAMLDVGPWDTNFPQYLADSDQYRRLQLAGWTLTPTDLEVAHVKSATLRADPRRQWFHDQINGLLVDLYGRKWGGQPGRERKQVPWDGEGFTA